MDSFSTPDQSDLRANKQHLGPMREDNLPPSRWNIELVFHQDSPRKVNQPRVNQIQSSRPFQPMDHRIVSGYGLLDHWHDVSTKFLRIHAVPPPRLHRKTQHRNVHGRTHRQNLLILQQRLPFPRSLFRRSLKTQPKPRRYTTFPNLRRQQRRSMANQHR